jgi:hypothetical protein
MMNPKLEKLKEVLQVLNKDTITPKQLEGIIKILVTSVKEANMKSESFTKEMKQALSMTVNYINREHAKFYKEIEQDSAVMMTQCERNAQKVLDKAVEALKEIKAITVKDGKDADEDLIVDKVIGKIKFPEVKEYILNGKNVVDVINNLPVNEENQIDASHIKNLPERGVRGVGSFGVREAPKDGKQYARKDRDWVEVVTGGGQVDTVVAGTGITVDATDPANPIVTNDNPTPYSLPKAAAATLGGIKVGDRLSIDANGVLSADAQSGSGDVSGPASAVADNFASFSDTTGKVIKDSGKKASDFMAAGSVTQYTDEMAQDAVGNAVGNGLDYDDSTGAISVDESELALTTTVAGKKPFHGVLARPVGASNPLPTHLTTTTFTLGATANPITYYYQGTKVDVTADKTATLTDGTAGLYFVYFNAALGTLLATKNFPGISCTSNVIIATVNWNGTDYGLVNDERHGYNRDCEWHTWAHNTVGARYKSGITLTHNSGTGAAATFATTSGELADEDIQFVVNASSAFPTANAGRLLYQTGAATYAFVNTTSTVPGYLGANARPNYVNTTGYALTEMDSAPNRYINVFVYGTSDLHTPIYLFTETVSATVAADNGYTSVANARAVPFPNLASFGLSPELKPLYRLIWRADGELQALTASDDYRTVSSLPMAAGNVSTTASAVTFNASGNISATTVQTAIEELDTEKQAALGFTPENVANKDTTTTLGTSDTKYPSQNAVKVYVDNILGNANALVYKGVIDCAANPNYPAADAGHLYIVSVAGKIGGTSGIDVEVGDMAICNTDSTVTGDQATVGIYWNLIQKNIIGAVTGPGSAVADDIAVFDSTTGKIIKDGGAKVSDFVTKALYDAQTILHATSDNTPVALTVGEQTLVGRVTGGNIAAIAIDSDLSSVSANDDTVPSAKATKAMGDLKAPLASPTFTGTITLADNTRFDLTLPTADTYVTGPTTDSFASGYSSTAGDLVFFGSAGKWLEVDADAVATCKGLIGIAMEAKTDTQAMKVALSGSMVRFDAWNWTVGATLYAGETLGAMQETIPTGADAIIKVVGFAVNADTVYFLPSPDQQSTVA